MFENNTPIHHPEFWIQHGIEDEIEFKASLSGGKGGQNVNKVNSKAEVYWNPSKSALISEDEKSYLITKLQNKLNAEGVLRITSEEERSLFRNKEKAIFKLVQLVSSCFLVPKKRKATAPTATSKQQKRKSKERDKNVKAGRKKINPTDY